MRWKNDATCAPHDHGEASGTIHLVHGTLIERRYTFVAGDLVPVSSETYTAPAVMQIEAGVIHDITAREDCVTVHYYAPAITGMKVYDQGKNETLVVTNDCGAWVPTEQRFIVSRQAWKQ